MTPPTHGLKENADPLPFAIFMRFPNSFSASFAGAFSGFLIDIRLRADYFSAEQILYR